MITGFNTDVEYQGVTYHVQTEDKGVETPLILSLVYNRGTILASKRSPYNDLLNGKLDEKTLAERLQKQHKLMCAAISAGRIEDLKRMTEKNAVAKQMLAQSIREASQPNATHRRNANDAAKSSSEKSELAAPLPPSSTPPVISEKAKSAPKISEQSAEKNVSVKAEIAQPQIHEPPKQTRTALTDEAPRTPSPALSNDALFSPAKSDFSAVVAELEELIVEGIEIIEDEIILPAEAVEIVSEVVKFEPPQSSRLKIEFPADLTFKGGDRKTISFQICRGTPDNGVAGAQVMVKVLGSSFRPLIFHAKTDVSGTATVHLQLPHFRTGRAALLVRAINDGEQVELRRVITHN